MLPHSLNIACSDGGSQVLWEDRERAVCRGRESVKQTFRASDWSAVQ